MAAWVRYKVDGYFVLDPFRPTAGQLGSAGNDNPQDMRNLLIVVPHSTEPEGDASRPPMRSVELPQKSLGDDGVWALKRQ